MKTNRFIAFLLTLILILSAPPFAAIDAEATFLEDLPAAYTLTQSSPSQYGYINCELMSEKGEPFNFGVDSTNNINASLETQAVLPSLYDSRERGLITSVKSQGSSNSCWAFTSLGAFEADAVSQGLKSVNDVDLSEAHLVWFARNSATENTTDPTYGDGTTATDGYSKGGNWVYATSTLSRWSGTTNESEYPFFPYQLNKMGNYSEIERYSTSGGLIIKSAESLASLNEIKSWIMEHGSAETTFYYNASYAYAGADGVSYYCNDSSLSENHSVLIVGWDDKHAVSNFNSSLQPSYPGAFLCKNSWGASWGDDGYFWLSYYDATIANIRGYTCISSETYDNNYTYNGFAYGGVYKNTSANGSQIANVFTSKGYENLSAVSTYTLQSNTSIIVSIYTGLPADYSSPSEGTLRYSSGEIQLSHFGYHTIELPKNISLTPNEKFSVIVKYLNTSGTLYIPGEYSTEQIPYNSNAKESYIDLSGVGSKWADAQSYGWHNNCIQAFTKCVHQIKTITIAATCIETGTVINRCSQCEYEYSSIIPISEHNFGEWRETKRPTSLEEGEETRICNVCKHAETRPIPKIVHSGKNIIRLDELINLFYSWLKSIFQRITNSFF